MKINLLSISHFHTAKAEYTVRGRLNDIKRTIQHTIGITNWSVRHQMELPARRRAGSTKKFTARNISYERKRSIRNETELPATRSTYSTKRSIRQEAKHTACNLAYYTELM